jgi:hypothetical protein
MSTLIQKKEMEEADLKILNEEDLVKPIKPDDIDEGKLYDALRARYNLFRKLPGEPIIMFDLINESGSVSSSNNCSA